MRIGIDVSRTAEPKTGLASYAISLVGALATIDPSNEYVLFPYSWHCFVREYDRAFHPQAPNFRRSRAWLPRRLVVWLWERNKVSKDWLIGDPVDVFFSPFHSVPPRRMGKLVCTFHDVAFRTHPQFSQEWNRQFCEQQIDLARRNADHLITVSEFSKAEIVRHIGIPPERITVVLEAADPRFQRIEGAPMPARFATAAPDGDFLLYVGSVEPRKNLITLVRALARLRERRRVPPLLVAGGSGWKNSDVFAEIERLRLQPNVHLLGFASDEELVALYNRATAFVFPTIYEGFGLPVIEAMSCGCPVVTTRVASIPEVGGDAVLYCQDPTDADELAQALERVLADAALRGDLSARGLARASAFSWQRAARETLAVFERVHATPDIGSTSLLIGEDERALESGWHDLESVDGVSYRWMGRRATLRLAPLPGAPLRVEVASSLPQQRLTVRFGRRAVATWELAGGGWETFTVVETRDGVPLQVALEVDRTLPTAVKGSDPRELGVRVRRVGSW